MALENTHYGAEKIGELLKGCRSVYFIGIGGVSMYSLALLTMERGLRAGGSDRTESALTQRLVSAGATVYYGHDAKQIEGYDAAVYTVAIGEENPEYLEAKRRGIPLLSRSDYLGYLMMKYRVRIGISGMHGKSTATAMCAQILLAAGDPTVLCGAQLPALGGSTCRVGDPESPILFEACEYMDSFLDFAPTLAVILNVGMDHVDYFHSMEQIRSSFLRFAERTGKHGAVLYNADDEESVRAIERFSGERHTFGIERAAEFRAEHLSREAGEVCFDFVREGEMLCRIRMKAFGRHNVYNALAAASAATLAGVAPDRIADAMRQFAGVCRRMEWRGSCNGAAVYDDYAHHPDEIRATLKGARQMGYRRVLCAYQPHTFSRTAGLFEEFSRAFADADRVFFADVYAAREENIYGVSMERLAECVGASATFCGSFAAVADAIRSEAREGDLVIVMGAGDVWRVFEYLGLQESKSRIE